MQLQKRKWTDLEVKLCDPILTTLKKLKFLSATPIQVRIINI